MEENKTATKAIRTYKDTVFRMIFKEKKELLSLFNAITGTTYDNEEELVITTLENAIYMSMKNDVSCVIDMQLHLYEHQSTVNPNLPLRYLRYVNIQYEKLTVGENIYSRKKIRIPTPKFIVFYNGTEKQPERKEMRLSDLYMTDTGEVNLELVVLQLNINDKMNKELKENCRKLSEYTQYVECIRKHQENKILEEAVECAIEECINKGILREFLIKNRAEVRQMSIFEYDEELHRKSLYEEGKEEGREEGGANKLQKIVYYMLEQKQTPETISNTIGEPLQNIYKLQESYIEMVREKEKYGDKKRGS